MRHLLPLAWLSTLLLSCAPDTRHMVVSTPLEDIFDHRFLKALSLESKELPPQNYDKNLALFVYQFVKDAKDNGVIISTENQEELREIKYVDNLSIGPAPGVMAVCNRYFANKITLSGTKKIRWTAIEVLRDASTSYTTTNQSKEAILLRELLYHELFHCLLHKGHLPEKVKGIMNPFFIKGDNRAFENWDTLVKQMFSKEYMDMTPDTP